MASIGRPGVRERRRHRTGIRTIGALILREMATSYGRSPGGYLWAIAEPVAGIALLTAVFSVGFRAPALGVSFPLFYASGMLPFLLFTHLSGRIAQSIDFSRPLLAYPAVTWLDAIIARFLLNLITQLMVGQLIFGGILLLFQTRAIVDLGAILQAYALAGFLGLGVGVMNCLLQGLFPVWIHAWSIFMRPMFLISTIFFTFESVPQPWRDMLWYNPAVHFIGILRRGFYPGYDAAFASPTYVMGVSLGLLALGMLFLSRLHRRILNR
ncbi:ABC transporter permease [Pseudooceanicola algae]|uniref:Polysialic acid transport protein KpsM n=1 Tax=Pseudooceanicola algae TaxID=1537215 RepID=A0A418SKV3_9RHOB|nr:ABC transporter permease [Pseudooceanicola algae]QPM90954.1 Polysialic acid transport protein KpsM [Pseudooceanicola algae]